MTETRSVQPKPNPMGTPYNGQNLSDVRSYDLWVYHQSGLSSDPDIIIYDVCVSFSSTEASRIMLLGVYMPQ